MEFSQVVRKRRSEVQYSSASSEELELASGSVFRNVRSRKGSASMQSKAEEAILAALKLANLFGGCYCEATIRQVLGDTLDTSKALRK